MRPAGDERSRDRARRVALASRARADRRLGATFGAAGLVALVLGLTVRSVRPVLGTLGVVLGVDLMILFIGDAVGLNAVVLVTGGLASVVLGPLWWAGVARMLWATSIPASSDREALAAA